MPSPLTVALIEFYGGAINRVGTQDTAYPLRDATYSLNAISAWTESRTGRREYCLDARHLGRGARLSPGQRVREFPGRRRRGRGSCQSRVRPELRAPGDHQSDVRSDQPVPSQPQHQAGTLMDRRLRTRGSCGAVQTPGSSAVRVWTAWPATASSGRGLIDDHVGSPPPVGL